MVSVLAVAECVEMRSRLIGSPWIIWLSIMNPPMNTPVWPPAWLSGGSPASSKASQLHCSNSRCCGSRIAASRGNTEKNAASKALGSSRSIPPLLT